MSIYICGRQFDTLMFINHNVNSVPPAGSRFQNKLERRFGFV